MCILPNLFAEIVRINKKKKLWWFQLLDIPPDIIAFHKLLISFLFFLHLNIIIENIKLISSRVHVNLIFYFIYFVKFSENVYYNNTHSSIQEEKNK